jgi:hypothetical protein
MKTHREVDLTEVVFLYAVCIVFIYIWLLLT